MRSRATYSSSLLTWALAGGLISAALARTDKSPPESPNAFLVKAIDCNLAEKTLAEKAVSKATHEDVRAFAQRLVDDHSKMQKDLMAMASDLKVAVAAGASKEHKRATVELLKARGEEFDRTFLQLMVHHHEEAVQIVDSFSKNGDEGRLRKYAISILPMLRSHAKEARELATRYNVTIDAKTSK